jgi:hypothetical protein
MALIGVIVVSALLMALAATLMLAVRSDTQLRGTFASGITGFYAAEAGLDKGMGEYRNIFLNYNVPHGSDFDPRTFSLGNRTVSYQISQQLTAAPCDAGCSGNGGCVCKNVVLPQGQLFAGLNATQYLYTDSSSGKNQNNDTEATVGANFLVGYVPLFQFVAFYANDLEIAPGPQMILQGRVHTNANLYLNADSGPLNIATNPPAIPNIQVTAAQNIYRGRKRSNTECTGTVQVATQQGALQTLSCNGGSATRLIPSSELATWNGSMIANLGNIAIPSPGLVQPPAGVSNNGRADCDQDNCDYWEKADLRIVMHVGKGNLQLAAGAPSIPYIIEAQTAAGAQDVVRTNALYAFMRDASWNIGAVAGRGPSTYRGTMPIFVTDVPLAASGCVAGQPTCANTNSLSYAPAGVGLPAPAVPVVANRKNNAGWGASAVYEEAMGFGDPTNPAGGFTFDLDFRRGGFYNWREQKWMLLLNFNVRDLIKWNKDNGEPFFPTNDTTEGGIVIFATIDGPLSNTINNYGIRVFGSADIPILSLLGQPDGIGVAADPTGVTVASDQAMYVLGDFNRGPPGPARQPASLIGDSLNVLSNFFWQSQAACNTTLCRDGQSVGLALPASRNALATTVNAAFLGGVDTTPPNGGTANYNGGLENYPRFQENWSGIGLNYQGSFVSLGTPAHVNGLWCGTGTGCNIYNPPTRNWNFDSAYNNVANLPPLTPRFVYVQQVLFTENFK